MVSRILDSIFALVGVVLLFPLYCLLAVLVYLDVGNPVFFLQERVGLNGKTFKIIKFRTMRNSCSASGEPLDDDQRVTAFGKKMRELSLDELPELFNVLLGEMSLVGPRPLLASQVRQMSDPFTRHRVLPGITGWAQVHGRNNVDIEEKCALDNWYVQHCSLALYLKTLFILTPKCLLDRSGADSIDANLRRRAFRRESFEHRPVRLAAK